MLNSEQEKESNMIEKNSPSESQFALLGKSRDAKRRSLGHIFLLSRILIELLLLQLYLQIRSSLS